MKLDERGARLTFRLLGALEVVRDGSPLALGGAKQRTLLALLLLRRNEVVPRERLIDALWGDRPPETAANSLQVAVHALRRLLGAERIVTRGTGYVLLVEPDECDLDRFERLVDRARAQALPDGGETLREALALWRGPALADLPETQFAATERRRLEELRLTALEHRIEADLALGRHAELVGELDVLVAEHPFRERLRAQLMLSLYRSGRQTDALEAYRQARGTLVEELGIEPGAELQELEKAILRQDASLGGRPPPSARPKTNLPTPATPLIGRRLEVAAVSALLRGECRLLTLTGPGGSGKTRLALEVASELLSDFADGAFFVDLAAVGEPELVASTIGHALAIPEREGEVGATLEQSLHERRLLLLLDNFEHLSDAAPLVSKLLAAAPHLKVLVTSRSVLRLYGEHEYGVPPLPLPNPAQARNLEALAHNDAVALFVARARAAKPDFRLSAVNAGPVAEICIALDGLPLALELAAARSKLLPPETILDRLERRLELLTEGPRDVDARQQTLRATVDWSYRLLEPTEQMLFARLAVFAGGATLDALEVVCRADLDALSSLVEKSLLRRDEAEAHEPRFGALETIREFALELLEAGGEAEQLRQRHADYYRELVERAEAELRSGRESSSVYARLDLDLDNFRAALSYLERAGGWDTMLGLAGSLKLFWRVRGHLAEGRRWLERALAHAGPQPTAARAKALEAAGAVASRQGDYTAAKSYWQQGLEAWRELREDAGVARCLGDLASVVDIEGDAEQAISLYEQSAELFRGLGLDFELATVVSNLGDCLTSQGRLDAAAKLFEEAVELCRASGREEQLVISLFNLGRVATLQDRTTPAAELFEQALAGARRLGYTEMIAYCLKGLAEVQAVEGEAERAARLLGLSDRLFDELGARVEAIERETHIRAVEALKRRLGEVAFEAAYREGRAAGLESLESAGTGGA